jgi:glyoxylase-like metal-dependent hydrolase (beta-lactamase superfamily II)
VQIIPNIHQIPSITANTYLIVEPEGLTLIDAGLPRNERKILDYIARLGYTPNDLKRILLTHSDSDHVGSLAALVAASQAQTFTSQIESEAIKAGQISRPLKLTGLHKALFSIAQIFFKAKPVHIDQVIVGGDILPVLEGLQVIETPGHTPGHLSFYIPTQHVLFCGDSLRSYGEEIRVSKGANTWDEAIAVETALKQADLGAEIVCAGHGSIIKDAMKQFADLQKSLAS